MTSQAYSTHEMSQFTGLSVRQLDYWACKGILIPSIQQACGSGSRKLYSLDDLVLLQFICKLKNNGWSTQKLKRAIDTLRNVTNDSDPLKHAILINGKNTIIALCKTRQGERIVLDALNAGGQQVMGVVLEMLIEEAHQIANGIDDPMREEEVIG